MDTTDTGRGGRYHLDATGAVTRAPKNAGPAPDIDVAAPVPATKPAGAPKRRPSADPKE